MLAVIRLARARCRPTTYKAGRHSELGADHGTASRPRHDLDGIKSSPNQPVKRGRAGGAYAAGRLGNWAVRKATPWWPTPTNGHLARKAVLETLLAQCAPCVILIDELVAYVAPSSEKPAKAHRGTFGSNLSFVQADRGVEGRADGGAGAAGVLPESDKGSRQPARRGALEALAHYFGRVRAL